MTGPSLSEGLDPRLEILIEAVSLKAVHSISRQKMFPLFFVGEEA